MKMNLNKSAFLATQALDSLHEVKILQWWNKYEKEIHKTIKSNGKSYALDRYKSSYIFLRNKLLQLTTQPIPFCRTDSDGIPVTLWTLRPLIKGNEKDIRIALCIARSYEMIRLDIDYSKTKAITAKLPKKSIDNVEVLDGILRKFLEEFSKDRPFYIGSNKPHSMPWHDVVDSLSKGPNGPIVASAHIDARAVQLSKPLYQALKLLNVGLNQQWITSWLDAQALLCEDENNLYTGRLGFSSEPAGKTRVFAMSDYWSRLSLKPIQLALYETLKTFSTDATANQDKGFKTLVEESRGHDTYCFDLSSASDRIPAKMQKHRMRLMFDHLIAESWFRVMTDRHFFIKTTDSYVRWEVGQPLGLLSSFPSFSLWHHDIVQLSANWENFHNGKPLRFFKQYRILGDDIVIYNKKVAMRYQLLLNMIGLEINLSKSIVGNAKHSQIEFAKRLAIDGKEISSISYNILTKNKVKYILDLVDILKERNYISNDVALGTLSEILTKEDQRRLRLMLWFRNSDKPDIWIEVGNKSLKFERQDIVNRVQQMRYDNIKAKASKIVHFDMEKEKPLLSKMYNQYGLRCQDCAFEADSIVKINLHPIVLALTQTAMKLKFVLFSLYEDELTQEINPIEYVPIPSTRSYFLPPKKASNEYLSKMIYKSFQEAHMNILMSVENPIASTFRDKIEK
jgi:hypothetical protein